MRTNVLISRISEHILPISQFGFRKHNATISAHIKAANDIIPAVDSDNITILTLVDYTKAFDSMNHQMLLAKLMLFGFDSDSRELLASFLTSRTQKVHTNNWCSSEIEIKAESPQGSVLYPLLFVVYTADFYNNLQHCIPNCITAST